MFSERKSAVIRNRKGSIVFAFVLKVPSFGIMEYVELIEFKDAFVNGYLLSFMYIVARTLF